MPELTLLNCLIGLAVFSAGGVVGVLMIGICQASARREKECQKVSEKGA